MNLAIRILVTLWGAFFLLTALRGIIDPAAFSETFAVTAEGRGINALRADFGSFFLVPSVLALWAAWQPSRAGLLYVPALLFGAAFLIRLFGLASGDAYAPEIGAALGIEAFTALFMPWAANRLAGAK